MKSYSIEKLKIEARRKGYSIHDYGNGRLKVYDPTDPSGGYLEAQVDEDGNITFKAKGFSGKSCMSFSSFEDAFGIVSRRKTEDYYQSDTRTEVAVNKSGW